MIAIEASCWKQSCDIYITALKENDIEDFKKVLSHNIIRGVRFLSCSSSPLQNIINRIENKIDAEILDTIEREDY